MKYHVGDEVYFQCGDKIYSGRIEIVDRYGAIGCRETSYDIYVASQNMLYKHVEESYVFTSKPIHVDNIMERDYRKLIRNFKPSTYCKGWVKNVIVDNNTTICYYEFKVNVDLIVKNIGSFSHSYLMKLAKHFNARLSNPKGEFHFVTVGKARCADTDTFDKQIGEKIALARAKYKANNMVFCLTEKIQRHFFEVSTNITSSKLELEAMMRAQQKYISKLTK